MRGPAAPKDPVEKKDHVYMLFLDKTISGSKDPEA